MPNFITLRYYGHFKGNDKKHVTFLFSSLNLAFWEYLHPRNCSSKLPNFGQKKWFLGIC